METLLVFLAIAVIQIIATYSKHKKEAAKTATKKSAPPPQATQPIPDPFRETQEAMGLPFRSIVERKRVAEEHGKHIQEILPKSRELKIDTSKLSHGILWTAILQEPRYKKKWKPLNASR